MKEWMLMQAREAKLVDGIHGNLCILSFSPSSSFIIRFERLFGLPTHHPYTYIYNTIHAGYQGLSAYSYPLRCLVARKALLNWGEYQHFALGAALGKHTTHLVAT
jgi:hypothetical protein